MFLSSTFVLKSIALLVFHKLYPTWIDAQKRVSQTTGSVITEKWIWIGRGPAVWRHATRRSVTELNHEVVQNQTDHKMYLTITDWLNTVKSCQSLERTLRLLQWQVCPVRVVSRKTQVLFFCLYFWLYLFCLYLVFTRMPGERYRRRFGSL